MSVFPDINIGEVPSINSSPTDAVREDAIVGSVGEEQADPHEPLALDDMAKDYFETVPEEEALNYVMFLHDIHAITFDRMNELKKLLEGTTSFMPLEK